MSTLLREGVGLREADLTLRELQRKSSATTHYCLLGYPKGSVMRGLLCMLTLIRVTCAIDFF